MPAVPEFGRGEGGFTLVELMVVIFVIGLMAGAVVLALPGARSGLAEDAERFALRLAAARDNAILQSRPMAVWISPSGYGFEQRRRESWQAMADKGFATTDWRSGTVALTGARGRKRVHFDSTGLPSEALDVRLVRGGTSRSVSLNAAGEVRLGD